MASLSRPQTSPAVESFLNDMMISGIKAVADENTDTCPINTEVIAAVTSTPLRKIGGGGFVSPAAFASQAKLISFSQDDVPNLVPSVIPIHRAAPVQTAAAKSKKKAVGVKPDHSQAREEEEEAEAPAVRRKTVTLPAASSRPGGGAGKSRKKSRQAQPPLEMMQTMTAV